MILGQVFKKTEEVTVTYFLLYRLFPLFSYIFLLQGDVGKLHKCVSKGLVTQ